MKVVDDDGRDLPAGERGEIVMRGPFVMREYWNKPEATAEALRDGWFHTGDIAVVDEDGYFAIVDRKKDLIIRGGYNVYPRELEEVLYAHPAVREAAVLGVPHDSLGEEVGAAVVLKDGAEGRRLQVSAGDLAAGRAAEGRNGQDPQARDRDPRVGAREDAERGVGVVPRPPAATTRSVRFRKFGGRCSMLSPLALIATRYRPGVTPMTAHEAGG
jgi:acyl-CoA synthetase (AMP-forming)/AMP-acid ligase II